MAYAQQLPLAAIPPVAGHLSGSDALCLLEIIRDCCSATTKADLKKRIFARIADLIPFERGGASLSLRDNSPCGLKHRESFDISLPHEFSANYERRHLFPEDTVAVENYRSFQPQYWSEAQRLHWLGGSGIRKRLTMGRSALSLLSDFDMRGGYTVGVGPIGSDNNASFCCFLGPAMRFETRSIAILEHLAPHLHQVLLRVAGDAPAPAGPAPAVSGREKQVLYWLRDGKSSWDISAILGISERTVNFHVYNIMQKLGAQNRSQAVALALHAGLIPLE
jgi:LuxR family transcriptional regulator, quorum-sensing system regulator CviR